MLISEVRKILGKYNEEELRVLVSEMYKAIPKKVKGDREIDKMIENITEYKKDTQNKSKKISHMDFDTLRSQVDEFIEFAYLQYYFAPNNVIHKKERPKWRFKVKGFIKQLQDVPLYTENSEEATDLLKKLYEMLCYGCSYYIFNTTDTFRSVGIEQVELLDIIIKRKLSSGSSNENIKYCVKLTIDNDYSFNTIYSDLRRVLISNLNTIDCKEIAIEECKLHLEEIITKARVNGKRKSSNYDYKTEERVNNTVETVFVLMIQLCEYDKAVNYFIKNYKESDKKITYYCLLNIIEEYELKDIWLSVYEKGKKEGVNLSKRIEDNYQNIIKNNVF